MLPPGRTAFLQSLHLGLSHSQGHSRPNQPIYLRLIFFLGIRFFMSQLTIYIDSETRRKLTLAARREAVSLSSWARKHLAKAAEESEATAWDHMALFARASGDDFKPPARDNTHRPVPDFED